MLRYTRLSKAGDLRRGSCRTNEPAVAKRRTLAPVLKLRGSAGADSKGAPHAGGVTGPLHWRE